MFDKDSTEFRERGVCLRILVVLVAVLHLVSIDAPRLTEQRFVSAFTASQAGKKNGREDQSNDLNDAQGDASARDRAKRSTDKFTDFFIAGCLVSKHLGAVCRDGHFSNVAEATALELPHIQLISHII